MATITLERDGLQLVGTREEPFGEMNFGSWDGQHAEDLKIKYPDAYFLFA